MANLSQVEIDALLKGGDDKAEGLSENISKYFTAGEVDALGEIGNICIGTSATTMSTLVGKRVIITTPSVEIYKSENVLSSYSCPFSGGGCGIHQRAQRKEPADCQIF